MRSPLNLEAFDEAVLAFYDAALGVHPWSEPLRRTADMFGVIDMTLFFYNEETLNVLEKTCGSAPEIIEYWESEWASTGKCPRLQFTKRNNHVYAVDYEHTSEAEMRRSPYYHELTRRFGFAYCLSARFNTATDHVGPIAGAYGLFLTPGRGHAQGPDVELLLRLHPHIRRAAQFAAARSRASATETGFHRFADMTGHGVIVVNADGDAHSTNPYAESLLKEGDGLRRVGGRLTARLHGEATRLRALIKGAATFGGNDTARTPGGALSISRANGKLPLSLVIAPLSANGADIFNVVSARAVIYISDPQATLAADEGHLATHYNLTEAEAAVAARFLAGMGVTEIAESLGVTPRTVRFHFHNLFDKCQVNGQVELMRVLKSGFIHRGISD